MAAAAQAELEDVGALQEEGTLLREERLEGRQVDHRGVGLDLSEVGVEREVQGEAVGEPISQIRADVPLELAARLEGVAGIRRGVALRRHRVGQDLEPARRSDPVDADQLAVLGDPARCVLGDRLPLHGFGLALDDALDVETPRLFRRLREAKLRERDPELRHPTLIIDAGGHVPDGVPGVVLVGVVVAVGVSFHACRVHTELERRAAVVIGIDRDDDPVGCRALVATCQLADDLVRLAVVGADPHVERAVVVKHPGPGALRRRLSLLRVTLYEAQDGLGQRPDGLVEPPVDLRRSRGRAARQGSVGLGVGI